ncbi:SCP-like extracellular [Chthoniobacter flavus Ellin428]|uniref:SCP-like extracellular n=1 Tax=Chthoniobacter flavus Ellin428 TaxID=497964 RepID=B4DCQ2_9BACT|nr:SCP-like extracellular [Chthoniobacter flavus Ellin428]TCO94001.1 hypothetical protein EV701_10387 [Chthoniobacter flavus]
MTPWHQPCFTEIVKFLTRLLVLALAPLAVHASDLSEQVLAEINLARTAPQQYAQIVASQAGNSHGGEGDRAVAEAVHFLQKARPLPPLTPSTGMSRGALSYVLESGPTGGRGHRGADGSLPWDRMARFGRQIGQAGENIDYGVHDARAIVIRLIVDDGVRDRGHRKNIFSSSYHVAGAATGYHATYGAMCVIDFAGGYVEGEHGRVAARSMPFSML